MWIIPQGETDPEGNYVDFSNTKIEEPGENGSDAPSVEQPEDPGEVEIPGGDLTPCPTLIFLSQEVVTEESITNVLWHPETETSTPVVLTYPGIGSIVKDIKVKVPGYYSYVLNRRIKHRNKTRRYNVCTKEETIEYSDWFIDDSLVIEDKLEDIKDSKDVNYNQKVDWFSNLFENPGWHVIGKEDYSLQGDTSLTPIDASVIDKTLKDENLTQALAVITNTLATVTAWNKQLNGQFDDIVRQVTESSNKIIADMNAQNYQTSSEILLRVQNDIRKNLAETLDKREIASDVNVNALKGLGQANTPPSGLYQSNLALWLTQTGNNGYYDGWTGNKFPTEFYPGMSGNAIYARPSVSNLYIGRSLTYGEALRLGFTGLPSNVNTFVVTGFDWIQQWGQNQYGGAWKANVWLGW